MQGTHTQRITGPLPILARLVWLATVALLVAAGLTTPSWAKTTRVAETTQNMAIGWNEIASTAIMSTAAQPPHVALLSMAMVQGAVYDAVNAIDGGHRAYLVKPSANPNDSMDAAAATAAFHVLVGFPHSHARRWPGWCRRRNSRHCRCCTTARSRACPTGLRRRVGSRSVRRLPPRC